MRQPKKKVILYVGDGFEVCEHLYANAKQHQNWYIDKAHLRPSDDSKFEVLPGAVDTLICDDCDADAAKLEFTLAPWRPRPKKTVSVWTDELTVTREVRSCWQLGDRHGNSRTFVRGADGVWWDEDQASVVHDELSAAELDRMLAEWEANRG